MRTPSRLIGAAAATLLALTATAVSAQQQGPAPATLVITNADIVTMDTRHPRAEALAAIGEWIVAVGTVAAIQRYVGPDTRVIDARGRLENIKGSLAPGRLADLVVLDRNLFIIPAEQILDTTVDYTVVGGTVVWDRAGGKYGR